MDLEFTNRYDALGIPLPDPATVCKGDCEGTGWVPVYRFEGDTERGVDAVRPIDCDEPGLVALWRAAEAVKPAGDGWHFVHCPRCDGSRLEPAEQAGVDR